MCVCLPASVSPLINSYMHTHTRTQCRSEKDASVWSKDKLNSLLVGLVFEGPEGMCVCVCVCVSSLV